MPNVRAVVAIVDDDKSVREALGGLLRALDFAVDAFASPQEFLLSTRLACVGCLIVDFNMPGMNGLDLHRRLLVEGYAIPTILITAYPSDSLRDRALESGIYSYLIKPFNEDSLVDSIREALMAVNGFPSGSSSSVIGDEG